jgi:hypothetical protein
MTSESTAPGSGPVAASPYGPPDAQALESPWLKASDGPEPTVEPEPSAPGAPDAPAPPDAPGAPEAPTLPDAAPQPTVYGPPTTAGTPALPAAPPTLPSAPKSRTGLVLGLTLGGVLLVVAVIVVSVTTFLTAGARPSAAPASAAWIDYPGVSYLDGDDVLAADDLQTASADSQALYSDVRAALTREFGLAWTTTMPSSTLQAPNGYGGTSMLYNYTGDRWQGTAAIQDPGARQRVVDIVTEVAQNRGFGVSNLTNSLFDSDEVTAKKFYGAATLDDQALWESTFGEPQSSSSALTVLTFDPSLPTDSRFTGFRGVNGPATAFTVELRFSALNALKRTDRSEFEDRLKPFAGLPKPEGNYGSK